MIQGNLLSISTIFSLHYRFNQSGFFNLICSYCKVNNIVSQNNYVHNCIEILVEIIQVRKCGPESGQVGMLCLHWQSQNPRPSEIVLQFAQVLIGKRLICSTDQEHLSELVRETTQIFATTDQSIFSWRAYKTSNNTLLRGWFRNSVNVDFLTEIS